MSGGSPHVPEIAIDRWLPLSPAWSPIYLSLFLAALLPVFVVHQQALIQRTVHAFLVAWLTAFAIFLAWPTGAPIRAAVPGGGFLEAQLRLIYASDVRANCFPSLHVAQCCLAAFACRSVHRGVGWAALAWASLVAVSTLLTKQHYVADVLGGIALAAIAWRIVGRGVAAIDVPAEERRLAPLLALAAVGTYLLILGGAWVAFERAS